MPSRPLTITLNSNHNQKFVLLIPDRTEAPKSHILKEARNKFRFKHLSRVFLKGGAELEEGEELPWDAQVVFVSKGEVYVGRTEAPAITAQAGPGAMRIIADKSFIDDKAIAQLKAVASLPGVRTACGMPDLHPGDRFPVGCAVIADGIYPALIGSDIGCGIALYKLSSITRSVASPVKLAAQLTGLDAPWDGSSAAWLEKYGLTSKPEFEASLGSVGLGNHFAEICTIERIVDEGAAGELDIQAEGLYLLVHTGSRGLGSSILSNATRDESNPYIPPGSPLLSSYLSEHEYAIQWAIANRDLVAHRIQLCLFPASLDKEPLPQLRKIVDVTHNSVVPATIEVDGETKQVWVHRKGAAPADRGVTPCPGSRGDFSWLLQPTGDGHENGKQDRRGLVMISLTV